MPRSWNAYASLAGHLLIFGFSCCLGLILAYPLAILLCMGMGRCWGKGLIKKFYRYLYSDKAVGEANFDKEE
jgi:hypothetical protein